MMTKLYTVDALVLRARDYGEADKILTLYTREQGKVQAIAKGARKPASRLRGGVQAFSHSRLLLHRGRTWDTVSQAEAAEPFGNLREDLSRLIYASYLAELLESAVPDREPNEKLFFLTLLCWGLLLGNDPELVCRLYEIRLLNLLGYRPHLTECMLCRGPVGQGAFFLDPEAGGILCQNCAGAGEGKKRVSPGVVLIMQKLSTVEPGQIFRLKVSGGMRRELEEALENYLEYHLDKAIKTKKMIKTIFNKF